MKSLIVALVLFSCVASAQNEKIHQLSVGSSVGGSMTYWRIYDSQLNFYDGGGPGGNLQFDVTYGYYSFRVGLGLSIEQIYSGRLRGVTDGTNGFDLRHNNAEFSKAFIQLEYYPYQQYNYDLGIMVNAGAFNLDDQFDDNYTANHLFSSAGLIAIFHVSESTGIYFNPMYQVKTFEINKSNIVPQAQLTHFNNIIGTGVFQLGIRYNLY